jgi:hypothetical protein
LPGVTAARRFAILSFTVSTINLGMVQDVLKRWEIAADLNGIRPRNLSTTAIRRNLKFGMFTKGQKWYYQA